MRSLFILLLFLAGSAHAAFTVPGFELVVTDPVETTLQNEDIREPADVWVEMIDGAKKTIDFGQMYVSSKAGESLDKVIERLEAAGDRGVRIRFLLEEKMQRASFPETMERLKKIKGLELRVLAFSKINNDGIIHAKYLIIDGGEKAFVGSQNFDWRALKHIHETGLLITDKKIAKQIQSIFDFDWKAWALISKGGKAPVLNKKLVPANMKERAILLASPNAYNPKGVADSESTLPLLINEAKDEIRIQLLDYYPLARDKSFYPAIDNALRAAQARKVKIHLMVSHWNTAKPGIDHLKSLSLLPGVEVKIVTLPASKEGKVPFGRVNHSKIMTIDKKIAWVGTSNWTGGYLDNSRNLELVVRDEKLAGRLAAVHDQMWTSSYAAPVDVQKDYPKPDKGE